MFQQKILNCRVVGACQSFQIFKQNTSFLENNRALSKFLNGIFHYLINQSIKKHLYINHASHLDSSSCSTVFFMILIFAALQVPFEFFLKLGVKWRRLWNSSKSFEFSVINLKWFFLFYLEMVIFTTWFPRWPTLWNSTLKRTTLVAWHCSHQRWSTQSWSDVVWRCKFQRWNT